MLLSAHFTEVYAISFECSYFHEYCEWYLVFFNYKIYYLSGLVDIFLLIF